MSHGDKVAKAPDTFTVTASTPSCPIAAMAWEEKQFYGVQFHPEVTHTLQGQRILEHFVLDICKAEKLWTPAQIIEDQVQRVREQVATATYCWAFPAASTLPLWLRCCTKRLATSSPAYSSITACYVKTKATK